MSRYSALLKELQNLKDRPPLDAQDRKALLKALRQAEYAVERPTDTIHRLAWAPLQSSVAKVAVDLKLFDIIVAKKTTSSLDEISKQTGADPLLLRRLLRFLSLNGMVDEPSSTQYAPNERTKTMADPGMQAGLGHNYDVQGPAYRKLPQYLKTNGYKDVTDWANTSFQLAFGIDQPAMMWAMTQPTVIQEFSLWMAGLRTISPSWLDAFPTKYLLEDSASTSPLLIDVGGGMGHQCEELKKRLPEITRAVILQDQEPVVQAALKTPGVENQVYDFFTSQPVKNASFYYLKSVLHDWPDDKVLEILKNQISAMDAQSRILLDEIVLLEHGGHWRASEMDIALMACAGSRERTGEEWKKLFDQVGLEKVEQYYYDDQLLYAIQILKLV